MPKRKQRKRDQDGIFERPDSPFWWCTYTDANGRTVRRSTQIRREDDPRKERAKAIRAQWVVETAEEKARGPKSKTKGPTFDELMVLYLDGPILEKRSHERDLYSLKRLAPPLRWPGTGELDRCRRSLLHRSAANRRRKCSDD
jgi:hypothetical protein